MELNDALPGLRRSPKRCPVGRAPAVQIGSDAFRTRSMNEVPREGMLGEEPRWPYLVECLNGESDWSHKVHVAEGLNIHWGYIWTKSWSYFSGAIKPPSGLAHLTLRWTVQWYIISVSLSASLRWHPFLMITLRIPLWRVTVHHRALKITRRLSYHIACPNSIPERLSPARSLLLFSKGILSR